MTANLPSEAELDFNPSGWATKLLAAYGLGDDGAPRRMLGWSNDIWATDTHVVRISSGRFDQSLRYEADVLAALAHLPCPRVVASGRIGGRREWMIQTRVAGENLMQAWPRLDLVNRERAIRSLAKTLSGVHATPLNDELCDPPWRAAALRPGGDLSTALRLDPIHYCRLVDASLERCTAPADLLHAASALVATRLALFEDDVPVLTHGDATFTNVIWDGTTASLIDFESSGAAPLDRELDLLLRFLGEPEAVSPDAAGGSKALYQPVLGWLRDAYPEMFTHPALVERLEVYDALWELVQLLNYPPDHPRNTVARLEAIVTGHAPWKITLAVT
jgi:hygromycin-B 7''-O-kinase